jgi:hypothetical protein
VRHRGAKTRTEVEKFSISATSVGVGGAVSTGTKVRDAQGVKTDFLKDDELPQKDVAVVRGS